MPSDVTHMSVEVTVEFPDLKPEDVELLDDVITDLESASQFGQAAQLTDLRDRVARMLLTACEEV